LQENTEAQACFDHSIVRARSPTGIATAADNQTLIGTCSRPDQNQAASACSEVFSARGQADLAKHDYDQAITDLGKALWFNPNNSAAARAFWQASDARAGLANTTIADYDRAIALKQNIRDAFTGRGKLYLATHDYDHALADLGKALSLNPNNSDAARAFWQALDERARLTRANPPSAPVAKQETPPLPHVARLKLQDRPTTRTILRDTSRSRRVDLFPTATL
jgi:tetratricopeptide (TPR) repeat protein